METSIAVNFDYNKHHLEILYDCTQNTTHFNKCVLDKKTDFFIQKNISNDLTSNKTGSTINTPKFRLTAFGSGLNVPGKCKQASCDAYDLNQFVKIGIGVFKISEISQKTLCRRCKDPLATAEVKGYFFYDCDYSAKGALPNGKVIDFPLQTVRNDTRPFEEINQYKTVKWKELTLTVENVPAEKLPEQPISPTTLICYIALGAIASISIGYVLVQIQESYRKT